MARMNLFIFNLLILIIFSLLIGNVSAGADSPFNYVIKGVGTQNNMIYPNQDFTWTLTTDWKEEYYSDEEYLFTKEFSTGGYLQTQSYYIFAPSDTKITRITGGTLSTSYGGRDDGTYVDTTNNQVVVKQFSGGYHYCSGGWYYVFGSSYCKGWTDIPGYYSAYYNVYGKIKKSATITTTVSGQGVVNALEVNKFISGFTDYPPLSQHGGSIIGAEKRTITSDNSLVTVHLPWIIMNNNINVLANTDYSETQSIPWENTEGGSSSVSADEGEKLIFSSSLIAPNGDTKWSVTDDNPDVETWMIGEKLYAKVLGQNQGSTDIPEFPTIALPIISMIGILFVMRRKK